jgi:hypothetical protein
MHDTDALIFIKHVMCCPLLARNCPQRQRRRRRRQKGTGGGGEAGTLINNDFQSLERLQVFE